MHPARVSDSEHISTAFLPLRCTLSQQPLGIISDGSEENTIALSDAMRERSGCEGIGLETLLQDPILSFLPPCLHIHTQDMQLPEDTPERLALLFVSQWLQEQGYSAGGLAALRSRMHAVRAWPDLPSPSI
jgi:hypothetical protein